MGRHSLQLDEQAILADIAEDTLALIRVQGQGRGDHYLVDDVDYVIECLGDDRTASAAAVIEDHIIGNVLGEELIVMTELVSALRESACHSYQPTHGQRACKVNA